MSAKSYPTDEEYFFNFLAKEENDQNEKKFVLERFTAYYTKQNKRKKPNDLLLSTFVSMGLLTIIADSVPPKEEYIKKTKEFHSACHRTWGTWFAEYQDK